MTRGLITAAAMVTSLAAAAPAAAETEAFVAYGTGTTVCTIEVSKRVYPLGLYGNRLGGELSATGRTDCSEAVQQTAHVWMDASADDPGIEGGYCSGFVKTCSSGADGWRDYPVLTKPVQYGIHLTAPPGQGWIGAPADCSGVGTDNLTCLFTALLATPARTTVCAECLIADPPPIIVCDICTPKLPDVRREGASGAE